MAENPLTTGPAARVVKCSEALIRQAAKDGRLASQQSDSGIRFFSLAAVEKFAADRRARRERRGR